MTGGLLHGSVNRPLIILLQEDDVMQGIERQVAIGASKPVPGKESFWAYVVGGQDHTNSKSTRWLHVHIVRF